MKNRLKPETTSFSLHLMAMVCMLCDHLWGTVIPGNDWLTCIGRLTFPLYAFLLVEGYVHTKDLGRYVRRLLLAAVLSEIPFNLVMGSSLFFPLHQNVLWSFLISIGLIHWNERVKARRIWLRVGVGAASVCIGYIGGIITFVDYYHAGILTVLVFYWFRGGTWRCRLLQLVCLWYINAELLGGLVYEVALLGRTYFVARQGLALLALIPIWLYRGKQGRYSKGIRIFYYAFYPLHLLILGLLKVL